jgi:diaminopimelate decarboxylase
VCYKEGVTPIRTQKKANLIRPFRYLPVRRGGEALHCDELDLTKVAAKLGTPFYVYSAAALRARFATFDRAFAGVAHTACFAVKANSSLAILKLFAGLGAGFDIVSGGELARVARASRQAVGRVVYSGVGKTVPEIDAALGSGILLFNLESESEMRQVAERAAALQRRARVAFRVNPDVSAGGHPYISTGLQEHKFGVALKTAAELYRAAAGERWLEVAGVSAHIGSQILDMKPFSAAVERLAELVRELRAEKMEIRYLDAGGGLGIHYEHPSEGRHVNFAERTRAYARAVTGPLRGMRLHLLLEPGRSIVAPAGALVTRVVYRKRNERKQFLVVDAAMNDLIRPSLYGAHHEIVPVARPRRGAAQSTFDVVGPICESADFLARGRKLPEPAEGDLLAVMDAGAYGMVLSSNYNSRPRAAEVMAEGGRARVIRRRESVEDLWRNEI